MILYDYIINYIWLYYIKFTSSLPDRFWSTWVPFAGSQKTSKGSPIWIQFGSNLNPICIYLLFVCFCMFLYVFVWFCMCASRQGWWTTPILSRVWVESYWLPSRLPRSRIEDLQTSNSWNSLNSTRGDQRVYALHGFTWTEACPA